MSEIISASNMKNIRETWGKFEIEFINTNPGMENQNQFYLLLLGCPFNHPLDDCVFSKYRTMPLTMLIEELKKLSIAEMQAMVESHTACYKRRIIHKFAS